MLHKTIPLFLCLLCLSMKDEIHYSIEIFVAKGSKYVHITSRIDLRPYYDTTNSIVVRNHIAYPVSLDFVQQKGCEYDYILFR